MANIDRPDPTAFKTMMHQEDCGRPDDFVGGDGRVKVQPKKWANNEVSGSSRVDDWLGSPAKSKKKSYKIKSVSKTAPVGKDDGDSHSGSDHHPHPSSPVPSSPRFRANKDATFSPPWMSSPVEKTHVSPSKWSKTKVHSPRAIPPPVNRPSVHVDEEGHHQSPPKWHSKVASPPLSPGHRSHASREVPRKDHDDSETEAETTTEVTMDSDHISQHVIGRSLHVAKHDDKFLAEMNQKHIKASVEALASLIVISHENSGRSLEDCTSGILEEVKTRVAELTRSRNFH
mmetsp:Transcript_33756/g.56444  ORF Transcript_33756/g.56444 Transcript_33756/m.56444 type:complete len:287 (+) Transcript_33756:107-967(+)|eukprot:CAMPEP_0178768598 /NCGR_PEP_ID=MMETSP0744-20121128/20330_1 /TAXON_ID=913974 /ORGANISM="Nitzschia punctata, Strain CCMP561" /LENGTH=286 /DNA_ID=CAMNT_0020424691 /DNA_START=76 /DNA_END=936 /DNA_ORIENTATION=-